MKLFALAAALAVSGTAIAQDVPQSTPAAEDPVGGYQPASIYPQGTPAPGAKVVLVPNPQTPTEAFPPPPPLPKYPVCKRGQFDNCRQRGG